MNNIKVIDYKAGNAPSVLNAINHLSTRGRFRYSASYAHSAQDIKDATHIILPGVGCAKATMESLREMKLISALEDKVHYGNTFFLGICVGMQILFEYSEEGDTYCLGWLKGKVIKFDNTKVKVPQMGWNKVYSSSFNDYFYFVNSYYAKPVDANDVWGTADYNGEFAATVRKENIFGTQFHIEKSGEAGLALLDSFLMEKPC